MTRAAWERTITDSAGNVLTGVQIAVFQQDGTTPATIYGQLSGGAALANPFNTGVQTSAKFYADPGRYVIRAVKDGQTKEFTDVDIADKAIRDDVGTAAYLAATSNKTDNTVGRALRVGDFGVGSAIEGVNIRTLPPTSFFTGATGNQLSGAPDNGFGFGMKVSHPTQGADYYAALYRAHDTERWFVTGTYGQGANPWRELYHTASAVGPVSFAGGVNTGAIIERGSNSNGNFIAFADGTLVCWIVFSASPGVTQYVPGINATSPGWTFPSGFQGGIPSVSVSGGDSANPGWASASEASATGVTLTYYTRSAAPSLVVMQAVAVGRWR